MRGVSVGSEAAAAALGRLVEAALAKDAQAVEGACDLVVAGFGMPVEQSQTRLPALRQARDNLAGPRLGRRPKLSAITFLFRTGWDQAPVMALPGMQTVAWQPGATVYTLRNRHPDAIPLPMRFTIGAL